MRLSAPKASRATLLLARGTALCGDATRAPKQVGMDGGFPAAILLSRHSV